MELVTEEAREERQEINFFATLEMPPHRPVRDILYLSHLFAGLLQTFGHPVVSIEKPGNLQFRLKSEKIELTLRSDVASLYVALAPVSGVDATSAREAEYLLARFIGTVCTVLQPVAIRWQDSTDMIEARSWVARVTPVRPRRVRPLNTSKTKRPNRDRVAVWPNRPWDEAQTPTNAHPEMPAAVLPFRGPDPAAAIDKAAVFQELRLTEDDQIVAANSEPVPVRLCSWALTGMTAALMPPAGASLAVLNLARGSDVRLSLHVLALTVTILALYQSGVLATILKNFGL